MYKIYTDGAVSKNGYDSSRGGYAWALIKDDECINYASYSIAPATNNICEMMAILDACEEYTSHYNEPVIIYSDSAYCINCIKEKWYVKWQQNGWINSKKQPVANKELWEKLIPYFNNINFKFEKVRGHSDNKWNNFIDKIAVKAKGE